MNFFIIIEVVVSRSLTMLGDQLIWPLMIVLLNLNIHVLVFLKYEMFSFFVQVQIIVEL